MDIDNDSIASMRLIRYIDGERGLYAQQVTSMSGLLVQAIANIIARALLSQLICRRFNRMKSREISDLEDFTCLESIYEEPVDVASQDKILKGEKFLNGLRM